MVPRNSSISRKRRLLIAASGVLVSLGLVAPVAAATSSPHSTSSYSLNFDYISAGHEVWTGPEEFAYARGQELKWLKAAGVTKINFIPFANGPLLEAAIEGGSVQVGELGTTPTLIGESDGIKQELVNQYEVNMNAWLVGTKGVTSLADLSGKTVATSSGSYMYRYLVGLLTEEHLTSKVTVSNLLPTEAVAALESGGVAAIAESPAVVATLVSKDDYPVIDRASQHSGLEGTSLTVASTSFLTTHKSFVKIWNEAHAKAVAYANAHTTAYYDFTATSDHLSVADAKLAAPLATYPSAAFTTGGLTLLKGTLEFLTGLGLAKSFSLTSWEAPGS